MTSSQISGPKTRSEGQISRSEGQISRSRGQDEGPDVPITVLVGGIRGHPTSQMCHPGPDPSSRSPNGPVSRVQTSEMGSKWGQIDLFGLSQAYVARRATVRDA